MTVTRQLGKVTHELTIHCEGWPHGKNRQCLNQFRLLEKQQLHSAKKVINYAEKTIHLPLDLSAIPSYKAYFLPDSELLNMARTLLLSEDAKDDWGRAIMKQLLNN